MSAQSFASQRAANESNRASYVKAEQQAYRFSGRYRTLSPSRMRALLISSRTEALALFFLLPTRLLLAQTTGGTGPAPSNPLPGRENPFLGSAPEGQATADVLQIAFKDAIDRCLRNNLGLLLA